MKILFICSSIEPGKDGVGDYTRLISESLVKKGITVEIVALYDKYSILLENMSFISGNSIINVSRIPLTESHSKRLVITQRIVNNFNPDWISLQFVPHGYNPKGLPFWLPKFLKRLKGNHYWQIMFHELWIGRDKNQLLKNLVISYLEEEIVKNLIRKIEPKIIHTHLPKYKNDLKIIGFNALKLPLFSNITPPLNFSQKLSEKRFKWAFFSQVSAAPEIIDFINFFNSELTQKGFFPELIIIGGHNDKMMHYINDFKFKCPTLFKVTHTGFLNENEISSELIDCNLGITPLPHHTLGKSGSVAAFLSHGIPVAAPVYINEYTKEGIGFFDKNRNNAIVSLPQISKMKSAYKIAQLHKNIFTVDHVSAILINDLKSKK